MDLTSTHNKELDRTDGNEGNLNRCVLKEVNGGRDWD